MGCGQENKKNYYCEFIRFIEHDAFTYSLEFKSDELKKWQEGHHSMMIINVNNTLVGKKFSYVTLPEEEVIRFTTRIEKEDSDYKRALLNLVKGEFVKISEPSGDFLLRREDRPVVLLSNGVGIAGVRTLIKRYMENQSQIPEMLLLNVDSRSNIYKEELEDCHREVAEFKHYYLTHRTSYYSMLYHELKMMTKRYDLDPIFYVTGSDVFVEENVSYLKDLDFNIDDIIIGGKQSDSCCRD